MVAVWNFEFEFEKCSNLVHTHPIRKSIFRITRIDVSDKPTEVQNEREQIRLRFYLKNSLERWKMIKHPHLVTWKSVETQILFLRPSGGLDQQLLIILLQFTIRLRRTLMVYTLQSISSSPWLLNPGRSAPTPGCRTECVVTSWIWWEKAGGNVMLQRDVALVRIHIRIRRYTFANNVCRTFSDKRLTPPIRLPQTCWQARYE